MQTTNYPDVNLLLESLLAQMRNILDDRLIGLYLYGSLVTGDYDADISDIDLLAAISSDLDDADFNALDAMHNQIVHHDPQWHDRIEIAYLSLGALKTFKTVRSPIGIISPGEPFHIISAGKDWLVNWYMVREIGITLYGVPPQTIIDSITKEEFLEALKDHVRGWRDYINDVESRPSQAYAILTMCRARYTCTQGEQVSKRQAALWAQTQFPEWSTLISNALLWRQTYRDQNVDHAATLPVTRRFVHFMIDHILISDGYP